MIDFGALFSQLISTYWWLLPLFVLAALFKSPWFKGFIGEVWSTSPPGYFWVKISPFRLRTAVYATFCKRSRL